MRLNRLVLKDFGLYRGRQEIELAPRKKYGRTRPIVLFGGHNGAGKTTILEALRLCLYGRLALGDRTKEQEYHQYLRERVHRDRQALIPVTSASVSVEFEYARGGVRSVYLVERSWETSKAKVEEDLTVLCNGVPLADIESQFWSDFLRSLIPPGLSQLFFFDGEKIQKLAMDDSDSGTLADSVKALLGLDYVERLQADLELYLKNQARAGASSEDAQQLDRLDKEVKALEEQLSQARYAEAEPLTSLDQVQREVARVEQLLVAEGHGLAGQRKELQTRGAAVAAQLAATSKTLRELCEGPLPFAVCPKLSRELLRQLEKETRFERWEASRDEVRSAIKEIERHLTKGAVRKAHGWNPDMKEAIARELKVVGAELTAIPSTLRDFKAIHGLSVRDREETRRQVTAALKDAAPLAAKLAKDVARFEKKQHSIQANLTKAPKEDEIAPRVQELRALDKKVSDLQDIHRDRKSKREGLEADHKRLTRDRDRLDEKLKQGDKTTLRVSAALQTREALGDYLTRLTALKIRHLEEATMDCFSRLARKGDLVSSIHIDPVTFQVELGDHAGRRLPKSDLSAGEKQIYAISVLWALARVSGRPLPMIIDTPLARLDSIHREKLVENYFPHASHQVIILSTDTEVDVKYYDTLRPNMSHAIRLVNHPEGWSEAQQGYFWKIQDKEDGRAAASP